MKIGIIGSAIVGQALAKAFYKEGYEVMLGSRTPSKSELDGFKKDNPKTRVATFEECGGFGEILVLATGGTVTEQAITITGVDNFSGKVVIDATNPIAQEAPSNGVLTLFTDWNESLMERLQKLIPQAKLVKAFSCVGNNLMYKPRLQGGKPSMFIAGNDGDAKKTVTGILDKFGWETEDMGMAEAARAIEPLCVLWCIPGITQNKWSHAFKLLKG